MYFKPKTMKKKFQDCNWIVKLWRYRWYLTIPFRYIWIKWIRNNELHGSMVWAVLIGDAQIRMNWVYEYEESKLKEFIDNI